MKNPRVSREKAEGKREAFSFSLAGDTFSATC